MAGKFEEKPFSKINLNDPFFDSLKYDYPEFSKWYKTKAGEGRTALVFKDEKGLGAFAAIKDENEPISLQSGKYPANQRLKISTLKLAERYRGQRLGEGLLGLLLWKWQKSKQREIYVTVFSKHADLISELQRFGFNCIGQNFNNENVYLRSRNSINYTDPFKAFPFINPQFHKGGYIIIDEKYHDTLFPYSELKNTFQNQLEISAANGISKVYVGGQSHVNYRVGDPVFIYRKSDVNVGKRYKSCLTSFCVVTDVKKVKSASCPLMNFNEFCNIVGNKSVFGIPTLQKKYNNDYNITVIKLLYYGFFGAGNNINMDWLDNNELWSSPGVYPANVELTPDECKKILIKGKIDLNNVFVT